MLSGPAFNAFLKTLEEPPPHVKFVFATTEVRKVPVTVLSRCQRFDLRRVDAASLVKHLAHICELEGVVAEDEALALIARAAEGSVRDAMSLLDQAIEHGAGSALADDVRAMLGLADRTRLLDLFETLMAGRPAQALEQLRLLYDAGSDPALIIADLADVAHLSTRLKILPEAGKDPSLSEAERKRGLSFAERLSMPVLSRAWQLLSRGLLEVQAAGKPIAAAEMLLIRLAYAANLPTPDEALRALGPSQGGAEAGTGTIHGTAAPGAPASPAAGQARGPASLRIAASQGGANALRRESPAREEAAPARLARFEDVIALARERRDLALSYALERDVRLVAFEQGRIEFEPTPDASDDLARTIARRLLDWTGERWLVALSPTRGLQSVGERRALDRTAAFEEAKAAPLVRAILERFPGAEILDVRDNIETAEEAAELTAPAAGHGGESDDPFEFLDMLQNDDI